MKIAHISSGAAGMFCGTCIHNNTLARALMRRDVDVALIPLYTPLRTDEKSVAVDQVFYGAINIYLQDKLAFFRKTPRLLDWLLDRPRLLNFVSRFAGSTDGGELSDLTLSTLQGEDGTQAKELERLVEWLRDDFKPDHVHLSLSLFLGFTGRFKEELGVPITCELQGEDIFFEQLVEPQRSQALDLMRARAEDVDAFIVPCEYYVEMMSEKYGFPAEKMVVVPLGIAADDLANIERKRADDTPVTVGYFARISPEKGFHIALDAFRQLVDQVGRERVRFRAAGYVAEKDQLFIAEQKRRIKAWGLEDLVEIVGEVDRDGKRDFFQSVDVFTIPTVYKEPKGLSLLEAMASGLPAVQPAHGAFPEILEATGGGLLVEPDSADAVAAGLQRLVEDDALRADLGRKARENVLKLYNDDMMAEKMEAVYRGAQERNTEAANGPAFKDGASVAL